MIRVAVAEDHALTRKALRAFFEQEPGFQWVAETCDAEGAVLLARTRQVDVIVLDLALAGSDGMAALPRLRAVAPQLRIVVLSAYPAPRFARLSRELGASFYLEKGTALGVLADVLRRVMDDPVPATDTSVIDAALAAAACPPPTP